MSQEEIGAALQLFSQGVARLTAAFPNRKFTLDGRLVGDIGEIIAFLKYDINLDDVQRAHHDAKMQDGTEVQIKATFKDSLTFTRTPVRYLGLKLYPDGRAEEVFNGPGEVIFSYFRNRAGIGEKQLSFSVNKLRDLNAQIPIHQRVPKRIQG